MSFSRKGRSRKIDESNVKLEGGNSGPGAQITVMVLPGGNLGPGASGPKAQIAAMVLTGGDWGPGDLSPGAQSPGGAQIAGSGTGA